MERYTNKCNLLVGKKISRGDPIVVAQDIHPILVMQQPSQQEDPRRQQTDDMVTLKRTFMLHQSSTCHKQFLVLFSGDQP